MINHAGKPKWNKSNSRSICRQSHSSERGLWSTRLLNRDSKVDSQGINSYYLHAICVGMLYAWTHHMPENMALVFFNSFSENVIIVALSASLISLIFFPYLNSFQILSNFKHTIVMQIEQIWKDCHIIVLAPFKIFIYIYPYHCFLFPEHIC